MKRHSRFITALLTIIFAVTAGTAITVYASENGEEGGDNPPQVSDYEPQQQESDYDPQPPQPQESDYDPQQQESDYDPQPQQHESDYEPQQQESDYEPQPYYPDESSGSAGSTYESSGNYYYDSEGHRYNNPTDVYVGSNQTYIPPSITPSTTAALYDTSKTKIDDQTLSNSDWLEIKNNLANPSNASKSNDSDDFAFIQNNTSTDDNGHWMLILGFSLIALSIAGFIYLIYASVNRRKNTAAATAAGSDSSGNPYNKGNPKKGTRYSESAETAYQSENSGYNDDYGSEEPAKKKKKSRKPKNGKRYK